MAHQPSVSPSEGRGRDQPAPSPADVGATGQPAAGEEPRPDQESALWRAGHWIEQEIERPGVGAIAIGAAIVVAASAVGVTETVVGAIGAYAVYRMLRRRKAQHAG